MTESAGTWSTQQLAEFLALVSSFADERSAIQGAVERIAEVLEAEVAALVSDAGVLASIGFAGGLAPAGHLRAVLEARSETADLPGVGSCQIAAIPLDEEPDVSLLVARVDGESFGREDIDLLRGMARVLVLTMRLVRMVERERERQRLLERLSAIQRKIVLRARPAEILDTVVGGVRERLGDDMVALRLVDTRDEASMVVVASAGIDDDLLERTRRAPVGTGVGGQAIHQDRLVVVEDYGSDPQAMPEYAEEEVRAAMAAPVREHGKVVGSLVVASREPGRRYADDDREALLAFAEHASLALTDAKTVDDALHQAFHDSLTGLPNRALFGDRLEQALPRASRSGLALAVLFLDLDRFKYVNDSLGHAAGDELLTGVGARLETCIRPGDTAARFGGDEFAILLDQLHSGEEAERVALRVLTALEAPFTVAGREVFISASIGIATGHGPGEDPVRDADLAMYRAKAQGKGRFVRFEPSMHTAVMERLELEADLQRAIDRGEFVLHYQPIVELGAGAMVGLEALLRWQHATRGLVPPGEFIALAEEAGLMPDVDRWVLNEATRQAAEWRAAGLVAPVAVNVSGNYLESPRVAFDVASALERTGLPPDSLALEITETVLMSDIDATIETLNQLKALGVRLAVDDFGTGYSSLQYLRRFPIDILKIDKAFVDDLAGESSDSALARAIIDLGESFELSVIAEGIECQEQRRRLTELGCRLGQGFLFARPAEATAIAELFAEPRPFASVH